MAISHDMLSTATLLVEEHRPLLEFYICDYLIRKNMHQTTEILMKDAEVSYAKIPIEVINPPEGMLAKWWKTSYEEVDFVKEIIHKDQTHGKALTAEGEKRSEGKQDISASQLETHSMNVQANGHLKSSSAMSRGTNSKQSTWLHVIGSNPVSRDFSACSDKLDPLTCKSGKCPSIGYAKIAQQLEPVFCALEKKEKAPYEFEEQELDPEIQHLIDTFWEVDNCPAPLLGEITLEVKGIKEARAPPKKLRRVYKIGDLL